MDFNLNASDDTNRDIQDVANNYNIEEICKMARENYRQLIITFGALMIRADKTGQGISSHGPDRAAELLSKLPDATPENLPLEDLLVVIQGGIIGWAEFDADSLESITQGMQTYHERSQNSNHSS